MVPFLFVSLDLRPSYDLSGLQVVRLSACLTAAAAVWYMCCTVHYHQGWLNEGGEDCLTTVNKGMIEPTAVSAGINIRSSR